MFFEVWWAGEGQSRSFAALRMTMLRGWVAGLGGWRLLWGGRCLCQCRGCLQFGEELGV